MSVWKRALAVLVTTLPALVSSSGAIEATQSELRRTHDWLSTHLVAGTSHDAPFSFTYDGRPSADLLERWRVERRSRRVEPSKTEHVTTYSDPITRLVVTCRAVEYDHFPTVEWTIDLANAGDRDTPILEHVQPLDLGVRSGGPAAEVLLHHNVGSPTTPRDYAPLTTSLTPGKVVRIGAAGGRPLNTDMPFFNLEWGGQGMIVVLGWPGQWAVRFARDAADGRLRVVGGQERTHFRLHPGESVRSPLVVVQFYEGDWLRGQNLWRRWMVAHNVPRPGGKLVPTHYAACYGNLQPRAEEEIALIEGFAREGIRLDYWIIDAGWYPGRGSWVNTGTWEVDRARFPHGLREVSDRAHAHGMKFIAWFEPERVTVGSWLAENHPGWVLGGRNGGLLDLGNREAWKWVVDHVDGLITSQGIDAYRQDFNIDPLSYWQAGDADDRQGLTEVGHVTGYLAFWDELLRRHPGLWIDTCASGGRRNDLETLRRSVPLLRSDYFSDPTAQQCQTYGISLWIPYYGSGLSQSDPYWFRSCIFPASRVGWDTRRRDLDYPLLRRMIAEYRRVEPYLLGDFYPLVPYSLENTAWMAWQFDRPETGGGVVQAFRRPGCRDREIRVPLRGLEHDARYRVVDLDAPAVPHEFTGSDLMKTGLVVTIPNAPGAALFTYGKVP